MDATANRAVYVASGLGVAIGIILLLAFLLAFRGSDGPVDSAPNPDGDVAQLASSIAGDDPAAPSTTAAAPAIADHGGEVPGTAAYESIRNRQDKFSRFADVPSIELDTDALTEPAPRPDNGASPEGQFRVACEYSHFGPDDPIIYPGQPGASHLHMFFGNTETNAFTTEDELINSGGGTCSGFELNRSAYWVPALLDGQGNAVVPDTIILYYKTKHPEAITALPQGLQMLAGNTDSESFEVSQRLSWSCGPSGKSYNATNRIPDCGGDVINATIQFPNCWDGLNNSSPDFLAHLTYVDEQSDCPASHPSRLPQISILLYWPGADSVEGWHLSSDDNGTFNGPPGGTLHADWWGGWNDETMELWIEGCMRSARNCSFGQTGTPNQLASLNDLEKYEGENFLTLPTP